MTIEEYEKKLRVDKQPNCKHKYLIGKSNGKFLCSNCDMELSELPKNYGFAF